MIKTHILQISETFVIPGTHLFIMVIIGCVSLIIEVIVLRMYHFGGNNVPERLRRLRLTTTVKRIIAQNMEKRKERNLKKQAYEAARGGYATNNGKRLPSTASSCARASINDRDNGHDSDLDHETQPFRVIDESRHEHYSPDSHGESEDDVEETSEKMKCRHHQRRREFEAAFILERAAALILIMVMIGSNLYIICRFAFRPASPAVPANTTDLAPPGLS